jgi:preprotein translocase subunit SecY
VTLVVLLVALIRVRSALTALVMVVALAGAGALWWWRSDALQEQVLIGTGIVLLIGAWRHLATALGDRSPSGDAAVVGQLSHLPKPLVNLSFVLVLAACSWLVVVQVLDVAR